MTSMNQNNATTTATAASTATVANKLKTAAVWLAKPALLTVLLALSTMAGAIYLPITPVPITLQTLVLCIIGLTLSWREGVASVVMYLAVGAAGLPVFAGFRGGWAVFVGPTAGFLVGFIFGVAATAALKRVFDVALDAMMPERSFKKTFVRFCTYAVASNRHNRDLRIRHFWSELTYRHAAFDCCRNLDYLHDWRFD